MPGPPPKPNPRRANKSSEWTSVPGACTLDPPAWPLKRKPTARERELWAEQWRRPQAWVWHDTEAAHEVAAYVRLLIAVEAELEPKLLSELRQMSDRLGTTPLAAQRNRIKVDDKPIVAGSSEPGAVVSLRAL